MSGLMVMLLEVSLHAWAGISFDAERSCRRLWSTSHHGCRVYELCSPTLYSCFGIIDLSSDNQHVTLGGGALADSIPKCC